MGIPGTVPPTFCAHIFSTKFRDAGIPNFREGFPEIIPGFFKSFISGGDPYLSPEEVGKIDYCTRRAASPDIITTNIFINETKIWHF